MQQLSHSRDYIFFSSYVQPPPKQGERVWSNAEELEEQNGKSYRPFKQSQTEFH